MQRMQCGSSSREKGRESQTRQDDQEQKKHALYMAGDTITTKKKKKKKLPGRSGLHGGTTASWFRKV